MDFLRYKTSNPDHQALTDEIGSNLMQPIYDECDYIPCQSVTSTQDTLDDNVSVHHSSASDDKTVHHSIASDDKTVHHSTANDDKTVHHSTVSDDKPVDHTPHSYEDAQYLGGRTSSLSSDNNSRRRCDMYERQHFMKSSL